MEVLDITNPRFNEQISPVPWHLIRSRFPCTRLGIQMVNKFPTVLLVCMLKHLWREKGTSVNRQDFKLAVALYLARQLCCSPLKDTSLDPALHSSFVIGLCTIIFCFCLFFQPILYGFVQVVTSPNLCQTWVKYSLHKKWSLEVTDPDLQIRRGAVIHTLR